MWCSLAGRVTGCWLAGLQHYFWCSPQELLLRAFNLIFPPKADIRSSPLQPWYPGKLLMLWRIRYSRDCVQLVQMVFESCLREGHLEFWVVLNVNGSQDRYAGLLVQHNSLGTLIQTLQQLLLVLLWNCVHFVHDPTEDGETYWLCDSLTFSLVLSIGQNLKLL